jgi:energy-coupling factor transporter transmembrane protein EcfT
MKIFFTIGGWITISVIIALVIFIIDYLEYKKEKELVVNGREIVWSIIAVLSGPITIIFALIFLVAWGVQWLFTLDWWTRNKVLIKKKKNKEDDNKETLEKEDPFEDEGTGYATDA